MQMTFSVLDAEGGRAERRFDVAQLIVAGWAGRDRAAVEEHIHELAAIGVPAPSTVPVYYRVAEALLCQCDAGQPVQVLGSDTSGEVEAVIFADGDELLLGVGSDHTDRKLEAYSIAFSKQISAKPVSRELWRLKDVEQYWDELVLRSWAVIDGERCLYQEGTVAGLLNPRDLFERYGFAERQLAPGHAMFCGTLAVQDGIRPGTHFEGELYDPRRDRSLRLSYAVETLPVVA
ncbi:DUF2848 domain-containing protein [Pararhodobacter sp.]|uniref:DUF2848 domain-containing protein n=1 Tax=Pararhodobacter sp. TaxID=2127056 RepID=UPI002FDF288A